jgi:flavin-dependent dehydrogenase
MAGASPTPRADVVIVGGGPAGTTTALSLAHARPGLAERVVLLERDRYPREKPCAGALGARGDALLREIGVTALVPSVPIDGISFRGPDGEAAARPGAIGRVVRRLEFDHALALAASARGIDVRDGVRVLAVREDASGAVVETDAGPMAARIVVGCDGVASAVRKSMGLGAGALRAQVVEVDTEPVIGDRDRALLHFESTDPRLAGYAWDFPTVVEGRPLMCRGVYQLRAGRSGTGAADVGALLADRLRAHGIDPAGCRSKRYAERGFEAGVRLATPRRMLVGEAAGIDPVTGEGIAQAIEFGVLAGRFLAGVLSGAGQARAQGWEAHAQSSRLARDLRIRARLMPLFYGPRRPEVEAFLSGSATALLVGCRHFGAQPADWLDVAEVVVHGAARLAAARIAEALAS